MPVHTDHRAHSLRVVSSHGRVPRSSSPRQRSDISRGARGRDEPWHVRPEGRQVAAIKPRTVALEGQEQQRRRFRLQWAALQGPSRAQAAQAPDSALEPKGSPCTRALGVARLVAGGHTAHADHGATHCGSSASYEHTAGHAARRRRRSGSGHIGGSAPCMPPLRGAGYSPARRRTRGALRRLHADQYTRSMRTRSRARGC